MQQRTTAVCCLFVYATRAKTSSADVIEGTYTPYKDDLHTTAKRKSRLTQTQTLPSPVAEHVSYVVSGKSLHPLGIYPHTSTPDRPEPSTKNHRPRGGGGGDIHIASCVRNHGVLEGSLSHAWPPGLSHDAAFLCPGLTTPACRHRDAAYEGSCSLARHGGGQKALRGARARHNKATSYDSIRHL